MNVMEWTALLELNGMGAIHEAAARIESKRSVQHVDKQAQRDEKNDLRRQNYARLKGEARKKVRLSSAERAANMMASIKRAA